MKGRCPSCNSPNEVWNCVRMEDPFDTKKTIQTYTCLNCGFEYAEES